MPWSPPVPEFVPGGPGGPKINKINSYSHTFENRNILLPIFKLKSEMF